VNAHYAAVVLAGGLSSRMQQLKPLLLLGGETITNHVISTFLNEGVDVFLVVGYRKEEIALGIKRRDINFVYNPDYEQGMFSSVQSGVRRLHLTYQAFFVLPVDIPLVRPATIRRLMDTAVENPCNIIYPTFGGKRGHPPLIPSALIPAILAWEKTGGLKTLLNSREKQALELPVFDSNILFDIDTRDDYAALLKRFERYELPTDEECDVILNDICKLAPDRKKHCLRVAEVAADIGRALDVSGSPVDIESVRIAARLHDIAKGKRKHDIVGGRILREMGFGKVGDIVAVHSDLAGGNTQLSLEAKIVYLADKFVEGERLVPLEERYGTSLRRFGITPEIEAAISERLKVAQNIKKEFENLLGYPLEEVIYKTD
jgi:molybdenum cofactor cytidylyltransferase